MKISPFKRYHIRQLDQQSCGVACLQSAIKYYGGPSISAEYLRSLSGTSLTGTTLLGLQRAAQKLGLQAEGLRGDLPGLQDCADVCILHIVKDGKLQHYVLCYGFDAESKTFIIGDPAQHQPVKKSAQWVQSVWHSQALLRLRPSATFRPAKDVTSSRIEWIKRMVREDAHLLMLALFLGIAVALLGLTTAVFSQLLLDHILPEKDGLKLFVGAGLLLAILALRSVLGYFRQLFLLRQSKAFNIRIVDYFYSRLLYLPKLFFDTRKTGDLIARMNDTHRVQRTLSRLFSQVLIDVMVGISTFAALFYYSSSTAVLVLLWIPAFLFLVYYYHSPLLNSQRAVMSAYAKNESNYVDTIQGIGAIKALNKQQIFLEITRNYFGRFQGAVYHLGKLGIGFHLLAELFSSVAVVGIIAYSAYRVLHDQLTAGELIAILQIIGLLMGAVTQLALTNIQLQEAKVAFDRMYELTSIESEQNDKSQSPEINIQKVVDLQINDLSFRFAGQQRLLENISFAIKKGEWIAILGESGCGKSTLSQILQKFYSFEAGSIQVNGTDLNLIGYQNWRSSLGVVAQQTKIFNATLIENILLGERVEDIQHIQSFLNYYGFDPYFRKFPNGYATLLGEEGINISGGQRQLVALARALYRQPEVLLLDEPTSDLDRDTESFVLQLLEKLKRDKAIILFTHRLRSAKAADRIYVLEDRSIKHQGCHKELLGSENLYSRAWRDLVG